MKSAVLFLALLALPAIAVADVAQEKKELQEDACFAWEEARGGKYRKEVDEMDLTVVRYAIEQNGWTKFDYALDRTPVFDRWQQVCERYFDRYGEWPERCCAAAPLLYGTAAPNAKAQGRIDRRERIKRLQAQKSAN